jgi:TubC N-terminal docking domain/HEAT repeats
MTAHDLLSELRAKGVEVKTSGGDRLVIDAPRGTVNEELRAALSANKAALIEILKDEASSQPPVIEPPQNLSEFAPPTPPPAPSLVEATRPVAPAAPVMPPPAPPVVKSEIVDSTAAEIAQLQTELMRLRSDEAARRAEVDAARNAAEEALRAEQEHWHKQEQEIARQRAEHERQRIEREARDRAEEDKRREIATAQIAEVENEVMRLRALEDERRREVAERMRSEQAEHDAKLAGLRETEEQQAKRRAEEERNYLEQHARSRAQEDELRRRAEMQFRTIEEEMERVQARENARVRAEHKAERLAEEAERRRIEEEARRQAEVRARLKAEEEARLRAEIEAQMRAEATVRRREEEETRRQAEEEARRRAEEEAQRVAAEQARRRAEEEAQRRAEAEARRQAEEAARLQAAEEARRHAEIQARLRAEEAERERQEAELRERADMETRIRAEIEAKLRAEDEERRRQENETRRLAEYQQSLANEAANRSTRPVEPEDNGEVPLDTNAREITPWFQSGVETKEIEAAHKSFFADSEPDVDENESEFREVSVPDDTPVPAMTSELQKDLRSSSAGTRASAVGELPRIGGEEAYRRITTAFDDPSPEVRSAAARALFDLQDDRAATFTRALREADGDRRRSIGAAISSSGLANEAISNLTGESRDKTYDAFSLLFLMSKAGEVRPLMRAIEEHPNTEVRLAVIKLLALSGQPEVLTAFRRMAVRGSLPSEVRSAVMEAIYQITSQSPVESN